jgi:hypothetical protein
MSRQPDAAKYEALVEQLTKIQRRSAAREIDALAASYEALNAVTIFLHADVRIAEREAAVPLHRLMFSVLDRLRGAKPTLLFKARDRKGAQGAPTYTSAVVLRSIVDAAFFELRKGGMSRDEAGKWLKSELARYSVKQPNEKAITASDIIRWDAERGGKSLKGSDEVFALFVQDWLPAMLEKLPSDTPNRLGAQKAASMFVCLLRLYGF